MTFGRESRHAAATGRPVAFEAYYSAPVDTEYGVRDDLTRTERPGLGLAIGRVRAAACVARLIIYDCHGRANQQFTYPQVGETGEIRVYGGSETMCVDVDEGVQADGTAIIVWPCAGTPNQQWTRTAAGEFRGVGGRCLDVLGALTETLTTVWYWTCHGGANQRWDPPATATVAAR